MPTGLIGILIVFNVISVYLPWDITEIFYAYEMLQNNNNFKRCVSMYVQHLFLSCNKKNKFVYIMIGLILLTYHVFSEFHSGFLSSPCCKSRSQKHFLPHSLNLPMEIFLNVSQYLPLLAQSMDTEIEKYNKYIRITVKSDLGLKTIRWCPQ